MSENNVTKANKTTKVLEHLKQYGSITSLEAIEKYSAIRLSAIIYNLRKKGYDIETKDIDFTDRFGTKSHYGKYVLKSR
jgi:hypothetical protein